jgi:aromatic ring-opening dioxygenase catalytic subunit (LigB family)
MLRYPAAPRKPYAMPMLPTYFISHGGGPWPYMKSELAGMYDGLEASLQRIAAQTAQPKAVLMVTAHWEEPRFAVSAAAAPGMIYDYGGFPAHTYDVVYPAPGDPALALRVQRSIEAAGLPAASDAQRGYDHGTFVPLAVMFPQADVPVVQLSIHRSYDPAAHLALGRALAPLRDEGVLIVGSGLSYHNLRRFNASGAQASAEFDAWLQQAVVASPPAERVQHLLGWADAPSARIAHPREDHLLPLMVAVGAAESEAAECVYHEADFAGSLTVSSFRFGKV